MARLSEYAQATGDSANLAELGTKVFTITGIEESPYDDNGTQVPGVKISTRESFSVKGNQFSKFHTTRVAIVNTLLAQTVRDALNKGETFTVKVGEKRTKSGRTCFILEDA